MVLNLKVGDHQIWMWLLIRPIISTVTTPSVVVDLGDDYSTKKVLDQISKESKTNLEKGINFDSSLDSMHPWRTFLMRILNQITLLKCLILLQGQKLLLKLLVLNAPVSSDILAIPKSHKKWDFAAIVTAASEEEQQDLLPHVPQIP
ncbi:uncharacterized protein LOC114917013 [Cajanus cajan]|uniref:uncharacterized protein LOC114917013 n=1 Tax=Cajanus cajan TaxID=3821 RepID=UPI0010FB1C00|nr:uncharacterized protein LOC114917013 [Cajanus cajan]